jgi:hypothetical protein
MATSTMPVWWGAGDGVEAGIVDTDLELSRCRSMVVGDRA